MFNLLTNPSILAQIIAIFVAGFVWLFTRTENRITKYSSALLTTFCIGCVIVLGSRTALLSILAAVVYSCYPFIKPEKRKLFIQKAVFLFLLSVLLLASVIKHGSTSGRLFIWHRCFELWKQNWLTGVGYGKFNPAFNHVQANYFSTRSLTSNEAILADDGYYAFNEWFHVAIGWGVFGLLLSLFISFIIIRVCFKKIDSKDGWAGAVLISILTGCLFSYPLHNIFIIGITAFLTGYITRKSFRKNIKTPAWAQVSFFAIVLSILGLVIIKQEKNRALLLQAKQSVNEGYKTEAYDIFKKLENDLKGEYGFSLSYLQLLYETNRLQEANNWFEKLHTWHCNQKAHTIIAKTYEESGDDRKAEQHFLASLYITPALLQSRMDLLDFYNRKGDIAKAKYWANEILNCPVKVVDNPKAYILKELAGEFLQKHTN